MLNAAVAAAVRRSPPLQKAAEENKSDDEYLKPLKRKKVSSTPALGKITNKSPQDTPAIAESSTQPVLSAQAPGTTAKTTSPRDAEERVIPATNSLQGILKGSNNYCKTRNTLTKTLTTQGRECSLCPLGQFTSRNPL
jgi:hypothetical protein